MPDAAHLVAFLSAAIVLAVLTPKTALFFLTFLPQWTYAALGDR